MRSGWSSRLPSRIPWDLPAFARDAPGFLLRQAISGGRITRIRFGRHPAYVVAGPDEAHQVLSRHRDFPKGLAHDPAGPEPGPPLALALGNGLLSSSGAHHARQRRLMQPTFSRDAVAGYAQVMGEEARRFSAGLRPGQELDLNHALSEVTLRILARTVFDIPLGEDDIAAIREAVTSGQRLAGVRGLLRSRTVRGRARLIPQVQAAMRPAHDLIDRLVAERRQRPPRADVLSLLLEAVDAETGERMSDDDVRDEVLTLLLAGHETTTNALSWTFALLAAHAEAVSELQREVDAAYDARPLPAPEALAQLPWVSACVDESMRLYPPAWLIVRHTDEDTRIGTVDVAAGSTLILSPFATQRIPALWPDPSSYDPARFAPGGPSFPARRRPAAAFLPFGGGPRLCIGEHFSLLEARIVLAVVARDWNLRPVTPGLPAYLPRITLGLEGGLPVVAVPRRAVRR